MKKILSLVSLLLLGIGGASAQEAEVYAVASDFTPTDGQVVEATASVTLTYGVDGNWAKAKKVALDSNLNYYVTGGNNPKDGELDADNKSTGGGYTAEKKNLPTSGTYFVLQPSKDGEIKAGIVLNANKSLFVTDGQGNCLNADITVTDKDGNEKTLSDTYQLADKLNGFVTFPVNADESYYVFCTGSKLGFFGFYFTEAEEVEPFDPVELAALNPTPGLVEALPTEFVLTYGGKNFTIVEDAEYTLTQGETSYPLFAFQEDEDGNPLTDKAILAFDGKAITTPGEWLVNIPAGAITVEGTTIDQPQSFKYTVKNPDDFTVSPAEGEVESLSTFTITANNYLVEMNEDDVLVYLFNEETEEEVEPTTVDVIGGGKIIYIEFPEVTKAGTWQLNVEDGFKNSATGEYVPLQTFTYTIKAAEVLQDFEVYFTNNAKWEKVYAYAYSVDDNGNTIEYSGEFPGTELEIDPWASLFGEPDCIYSFQAAEAPQYIIFSDGDLQQTDILNFENGKEYENEANLVNITVDNIAGLSDVDAAGIVTVTLVDAVVTYSSYDEEEYTGKLIIEDETGGVLIEDGTLAQMLEEGMVLNGELPLEAVDYLGSILFQGDLDSYMDYINLIAEAGETEVTPLELTDDTVLDWMFAYNWKLIKATGVIEEEEGTYGADTYLKLDATGQSYAILDVLSILSEEDYPAADTKVEVVGWVYDFDLYGSDTPFFQPLTFKTLTPDGIKGISVSDNNAAVYNLNGQKIQNAQKGLYIQNGKKVVVK